MIFSTRGSIADHTEYAPRRLRMVTKFQRMHGSHEYDGEADERAIDMVWPLDIPERIPKPMPGTVSFEQGVEAMKQRNNRRRLIRKHMEKIADAFVDMLDEADGWK